MTSIKKVEAAKNNLHSPDAKREYNERHFSEAAPEYDRATRLLSLGRDAAWKCQLIKALPELTAPHCLDLACGTGDICFLLAERFHDAQIEGLDLTAEMLLLAEIRNSFDERVRFVLGDMGALPQVDASVDLVTGSYALRNAPDLERALQEINRVLRPGGYAAFLDFSKPDSAFLQALQFRLLKFWGSFCGWWFHRNPAVHGYISESLRDFLPRSELNTLLDTKGFTRLKAKRFYGGIVELFVIQKNA